MLHTTCNIIQYEWCALNVTIILCLSFSIDNTTCTLESPHMPCMSLTKIFRFLNFYIYLCINLLTMCTCIYLIIHYACDISIISFIHQLSY